VRFTGYSFGSVRVDDVTYHHDPIIDRGNIRKRKKAASKRLRGAYGHTPLSIGEDVPWRCRRLVIGTGAGGATAGDEGGPRRGPPSQSRPCHPAHGRGDRRAGRAVKGTNAILHVTCRPSRAGRRPPGSDMGDGGPVLARRPHG